MECITYLSGFTIPRDALEGRHTAALRRLHAKETPDDHDPRQSSDDSGHAVLDSARPCSPICAGRIPTHGASQPGNIISTANLAAPYPGKSFFPPPEVLQQVRVRRNVPLEQREAPVPSGGWTALTLTLAELQPCAFAILARLPSSAPAFPEAVED